MGRSNHRGRSARSTLEWNSNVPRRVPRLIADSFVYAGTPGMWYAANGRNSQPKMTARIVARCPGNLENRYSMAGIQPNMATGIRYGMSPIEPLLDGRRWAYSPTDRN